MTVQRVSPAALPSLRDALTAAFWFKSDLHTFLDSALRDRTLVSQLDFEQTKRQVVYDLVRILDSNQHKHFDQLVDLILAVSDIKDPQWLKKLENGQEKYQEALDAIGTLKLYATPFEELRSKAEEQNRLRQIELKRAESRKVQTAAIQELNHEFQKLSALDPQPRGYALESLMNSLFRIFEIDAKGPFRNHGEQIDGAFSLDGVDFILEVKWKKELTPLADLEAFRGKVNRKLDNTLGLFLSMNGFQPSAVELLSIGGRPSILLSDGSDLAAVLDDRISLPELLRGKRQHASQTGEIFITGWELLTG